MHLPTTRRVLTAKTTLDASYASLAKSDALELVLALIVHGSEKNANIRLVTDS